MELSGVGLPQALVESITEALAKDWVDWPAWDEHREEVLRLMREEETCACGSARHKMWNSCRAACNDRDDLEYKARIGDTPRLALDQRLANIHRWDTVCKGSRVHDACWRQLLREDCDVRKNENFYQEVPERYPCTNPSYRPLIGFEKAITVLGASAKLLLARNRNYLTDQQLVDVHRALVLDDEAEFVALARRLPRVLLDSGHIDSGSGDRTKIGFPEAKRSELLVDPAVQHHISWLPHGAMPRVLRTLVDVFFTMRPASIIQLLGVE